MHAVSWPVVIMAAATLLLLSDAQQQTTAAPPDATTATVVVFIDGHVTDASTTEDDLCQALGYALPCARFHCSALDLSNIQYTVATIRIDSGSPSAPYLASQAAAKSFVTRPYGVFNVIVVTAPPPDSPGLISSADQRIYLAAGCTLAGALFALMGVCCCVKLKSSGGVVASGAPVHVPAALAVGQEPLGRPSPLSAVGGRSRSLSTVNRAAAPLAESEALWKKLRELDQRTEKLATAHSNTDALLDDINRELATMASQHGPTSSSAGGGLIDDYVASEERKLMKHTWSVGDQQPTAGVASAAEPWWRREGVTDISFRTQEGTVPLFLGRDNTQGTSDGPLVPVLHHSLVGSSLADRIPASMAGHWHLRADFPKLPNSVAAMVHVAKSTLCGLGVFAVRFIAPQTILFPYVTPEWFSADAIASIRFNERDLALRFGWDWSKRLNFVARDAERGFFIVAEDPSARGWGCLLNSAHGDPHLAPNCELVWSGSIPYVRTITCVPPLAELLLDYSFPR